MKETPSLEKAWAYFEHVTLTRFMSVQKKKNVEKKTMGRRILNRFSKADQQLDRAEPGEQDIPTKLYHPFFTPYKQLGDFGLGIGLYFATIRALTALVLVAGIIHMPNILYFAGDKYSDGQKEVNKLRRGSAICTNSTWVVCPTCTNETFPEVSEGYTWVRNDVLNLTMARKNLCEGATISTGVVNFCGFLAICIGSVFLFIYMNRMEKQFDEDEQTAQDYSILIDNPPEDARDPMEWKEFFEDNFNVHVTCCTIGLDNDRLVGALVERREKMRKLECWVEPGTSLDMVTLAGISIQEEKKRSLMKRVLQNYFVPGFPETFGRLAVLTAEVQGLAQQEYPVSNVFLTFETEAAQRLILESLTVSRHDVSRNKLDVVADPKFLFRGNHLLNVSEPEEPDSIKWEHLNASFKELMKQQICTALATFVALTAVAMLVKIVNEWNVIFTAYTIAFTNVMFPFSAKALTRFESHPTHGSLQTSLYFKIALFRWVTTAIVITIITPFEDTIRNGPRGLITQIQAQFVAEITTVAAIQISDPLGHFRRHFLAPRSKTQDQMNINMQGTQVELAERYTSVSKILFLTFWYCAIYPATFFICAFALQVIFVMDKFSLTRTWKRSPRLGSRISKFNRSYFLPLSIVAMAVFSSYFWSGFPYDNLCEDDDSQVSDALVGDRTFEVREKGTQFTLFGQSLGGGDNTTKDKILAVVNTTIQANQTAFKYCDQDFLPRAGGTFGAYPFVPIYQPVGGEWMTPDQETVTTYFGWISFFFALGWMILVGFRGLRNVVFGYFAAVYRPIGDDQKINFSAVEAINTYIPEVKSNMVAYPLLAASVDNIDKEMMEWHDPEHPHSYYDLTKDAIAMVKHRGICNHDRVFSQVFHWPPDTEVVRHLNNDKMGIFEDSVRHENKDKIVKTEEPVAVTVAA